MKVLVINSGSSSLKYQLIDMETEGVIAKGNCERIGIDGSKLTHKAKGMEVVDKLAEEITPIDLQTGLVEKANQPRITTLKIVE